MSSVGTLCKLTVTSTCLLKDLGDLPPPSALSLQTVRVKVEKRASIDGPACAASGGAAVTGASKQAAASSSSTGVSPKSSPIGENRRDSRRDSRDSTVPFGPVNLTRFK